MLYRKYAPSLELSPFVECYYAWEYTFNRDELIVESPPSAFTAMVINYSDDYFAASADGIKYKVPPQFLVGQLTKSYWLHFPGNIGQCAIVFKPTGVSSLFRLPMYSFTNERVDLFAIMDRNEMEILINNIIATSLTENKIEVLESFLINKMKLQAPVVDAVDEAANIIVEQQGNVNINELCERLFVSRRQLEKKFLQRVGLSPKYYARLRRIGAICREMAGKKAVNWQDLYYKLDYYDQSHFIKDFTEFTGRSPRDYIKTNKELKHHLKENED